MAYYYEEEGYVGESDHYRVPAARHRFREIKPLVDREFYEYYKTVRRRVVQPLDKYIYFQKAIGGLMLQIKRASIESDHGVYIEKLLYMSRTKGHLIRDRRTKLKKYIQVFKTRIEFLDPYIEDKWKCSSTILYNYPKFKLDRTREYAYKKDEIELLLRTQINQRALHRGVTELIGS